MALVDKTGRLVRFTIRPGNAAENLELPTLLDGVKTSEVIADKAYDSNAIRRFLAESDIIATIPPKSNRRVQYWYDKASYRTRHLVENLFADMKQFRGIATRYCKLGESYRAFINLAGWVLDTKPGRRTAKPPGD
jgi:transposase